MRRPHPDDLGRLEQTLRDLERGTFLALASYNDRREPGSDQAGPVADGWVRGQHPTAVRLLNHAYRQYDTRLLVRTSRRPWAQAPGLEGVLWHADFLMRDRSLDPARLWHDSGLRTVRPLLVHMLTDHPGHVGFTFAAADDPVAVSDAIGAAFDAVLTVSRHGPSLPWRTWERRARTADHRILAGTGWNIVDEFTVPISAFGSGGGVEAPPEL